jgi:hypothetical protein
VRVLACPYLSMVSIVQWIRGVRWLFGCLIVRTNREGPSRRTLLCGKRKTRALAAAEGVLPGLPRGATWVLRAGRQVRSWVLRGYCGVLRGTTGGTEGYYWGY